MKKLLTFICLLISNLLMAQNNNVGIGTNSPDASAQLHINGNNQGLLIPRMTSTQRLAITNPAPGLLLYDTDKRTIYLFDGQNWLPFAFAVNTNALPPTPRTTGNVSTGLGYRVAIDSAGILAATDNGRVFYFETGGGNFTHIEEIISSAGNPGTEKFGSDVAISGTFAAIGAPGGGADSGKVYIFERTGGAWVQRQLLKSTVYSAIGNGFGTSVAMNGNTLLVGAPFDDPFSSADEGTFHVYKRVGSSYNALTIAIQPGGSGFAPGDYFGWDVAVMGNHILVGAPGHSSREGKVYFYHLAGSTLTLDYQHAYSVLAEPNILYGYSVAIDSAGAIIGFPGVSYYAGGYHIIGNFGSPLYGDEALEFEQYVISRSGTSTADRNRFFGASVSISGNHYMVATPDKIDPLFSAAKNFIHPSAAEIYQYNKQPGAIYFNLLGTWESTGTGLNGMGIGTALWNNRAVAGHDEANKFFVKDWGVK